MNFLPSAFRHAMLASSCAMLGAVPVSAQSATAQPATAQQRMVAADTAVASGPTYADLVDLAEGTPLVLKARVKDQAVLKPERAPNLAPGFARLYVEAQTQALLAGNVPVGESLRYLVDVPLDAKGKVPKFKKQDVLLFARPVPGRPNELQLVDPRAQLAWTPDLESRLRPVLEQLATADRPPQVTGGRDALSIAGTLVGESETQLFLDTENDGPVSITVVRRPGMEPRWGVSWTEIVDQAARPPRAGTLEWYRLACALPRTLPADANLSRDAQSRARATEDYAWVISRLGPCERRRDSNRS